MRLKDNNDLELIEQLTFNAIKRGGINEKK